ncbi:unnamed protein product [Phaeothamnion confervicola]
MHWFCWDVLVSVPVVEAASRASPPRRSHRPASGDGRSGVSGETDFCFVANRRRKRERQRHATVGAGRESIGHDLWDWQRAGMGCIQGHFVGGSLVQSGEAQNGARRDHLECSRDCR